MQIEGEAEQVADSEEQLQVQGDEPGNEDRVNELYSDSESTNQAEEEIEEYTKEITSLKRKRTYAFGRTLNARL